MGFSIINHAFWGYPHGRKPLGAAQALIGDLHPVAGKLKTSGSMAYTPQVAWIRNATVKDNIVFNSRWERLLRPAGCETTWWNRPAVSRF